MLSPVATKPNRGARGPRRLSEQQKRFLLEYVIDLNGDAAARRAGYKSGKAIACQILRRPDAKAELARLLEERKRASAYTRERAEMEYEEARQIAIKLGDARAAVAATQGKARLFGLEVERHEVSGRDGAPIQVDNGLMAIVAARLDILARRAQGTIESDAPPALPEPVSPATEV